jgi:hypothetical protein
MNGLVNLKKINKKAQMNLKNRVMIKKKKVKTHKINKMKKMMKRLKQKKMKKLLKEKNKLILFH